MSSKGYYIVHLYDKWSEISTLVYDDVYPSALHLAEAVQTDMRINSTLSARVTRIHVVKIAEEYSLNTKSVNEATT